MQIIVVLLIALLLVIPTGRYLYALFSGGPEARGSLERFCHRLIGVPDPAPVMTWQQYAGTLLLTNGVMAVLAYLLLRLQALFPWNPRGFGGMEPTLALHTAISFVTNTNLQHYNGETTLSNFSQMAVITFLMFTASASGFAAAIAFIRGLAGQPLGNFWTDTTRVILKVLLPVSFVLALVLVWQGVPQTLTGGVEATTLSGARQIIPLGPVASLESIKHVGTNGGGFFGSNAAHPFENPTPLTNVLHILAMLWIPTAFLYLFGLFIQNRRQGWIFFAAVSVLFVAMLAHILFYETQGNPALHRMGLPGPNMEGKEVRFGLPGSALFTTVTTAATTGSVNSALNSLTPLAGLAPLVLMMLNSVFGGKGVGFMLLTAMAMLTVFLVGLMVGRTPEFLRKKLETKEIVLLAITILIHPLITLIPASMAVLTAAGRAGISQTAFHGLTQVIYEYTSAAANNGSEFGGIVGNAPFWNLTTTVVMALGRYLSLISLLAVSGFMLAKRPVPESPGTLRTDTPIFAVVLVVIILIVGALTFFPALALGPIAEHLTLSR
ncbi:MAG: potassium-transporting ATPase subunit KdpA [Mycobacterium leprae]